MYNPFAETIRAQWMAMAAFEVEGLNIVALTDYNTKYDNYVQNWKNYSSEPWFDSRYTLPVPENAWVIGEVDFEENGVMWKVPGPVQSDKPVCEAKPAPKRETAPDGVVAEFSAPCNADRPNGPWRAGRWTTAPHGYEAVNPHNKLKYILNVSTTPFGRLVYWVPAPLQPRP